jgi:hypothetical protein
MLYAALDTLDILDPLGTSLNEIPPRSNTWPLLPH